MGLMRSVDYMIQSLIDKGKGIFFKKSDRQIVLNIIKNKANDKGYDEYQEIFGKNKYTGAIGRNTSFRDFIRICSNVASQVNQGTTGLNSINFPQNEQIINNIFQKIYIEKIYPTNYNLDINDLKLAAVAYFLHSNVQAVYSNYEMLKKTRILQQTRDLPTLKETTEDVKTRLTYSNDNKNSNSNLYKER